MHAESREDWRKAQANEALRSMGSTWSDPLKWTEILLSFQETPFKSTSFQWAGINCVFALEWGDCLVAVGQRGRCLDSEIIFPVVLGLPLSSRTSSKFTSTLSSQLTQPNKNFPFYHLLTYLWLSDNFLIGFIYEECVLLVTSLGHLSSAIQ